MRKENIAERPSTISSKRHLALCMNETRRKSKEKNRK